MIRSSILASFAFAFALAVPTGTAAADARPTIGATRATGPIHVDGVLDEADWARATPITDFRLIFVNEGGVPSESTSVRVLVDDHAIYFGVFCANRGPGAIRSSLNPRDEIDDDDQIDIHLDTYHDRRRAYLFGVNPHGVQLDGVLEGDTPDFSWDGVWDAETRIGPDGWTAEIAVPLRAMRFPSNGDGVWGLWIRRQITKNDETCSWPLWRQSVQGDIMLQEADLTGLEGLSGGGGLEGRPYFASTRDETRDAGPPNHWSHNTDAAVGFDAAYAPSTAFTSNLTINPDYSQIEADALQIEVNRRFPLSYAEKRPFFLEGAEIFATPLDLVYTRRIVDPSVGGKLVGKTGALRVGAIAVREAGGADGFGDGHLSSGVLRRGFVGIGRARLDLGENSNVGLLVTAQRADAGEPPLVMGYLRIPEPTVGTNGSNIVYAADTRLRLTRSVFFVGQAAWSRTRVDSVRTISRSVSDRHVVGDGAYSAKLEYGDGIRNLSAYQEYLGPRFVTATGFLERTDIRESGVESSFYVRPENAWIRSWQPILDGYVIHDHDGRIQEWWWSPMIDWAFQKQTTMHTMYERSMQRWQGRDYDLNTYFLDLGNALFRPLSADLTIQVGDGIFYGPTDAASFKGWAESYELEATARPSPRLTSKLSVTRSRFLTRRGGAQVFDVWVMGANTTFQFTRRLYVRVYPQYDSGEEHLDADALVGYVVGPGSVLYLGANGDYDHLDGRTRNTARSYFLKISYVFQH